MYYNKVEICGINISKLKTLSAEETEKIINTETIEKMKEIAEAEKAKKEQKSVDEIMEKVLDFIKENKSNMAAIKPIVTKCKEEGVNPTEVKDIKLAKELLSMIP